MTSHAPTGKEELHYNAMKLYDVSQLGCLHLYEHTCVYVIAYFMYGQKNCPIHIKSNSLAQYVKSTCFISYNFQSIYSRFLKSLYVVKRLSLIHISEPTRPY